MAKRKNDGVRRVMMQVYVDQNILLSAANSKMTNAEFVEAMFKKIKAGDFPDDMPVDELQAKYVELDRTLRALGSTIENKKNDQETKAKAALEHKDEDNVALERAVIVITDCMLKPERERTKTPGQLAELRAGMLASATQGRVNLSPDELYALAVAKMDSRRAELEAEEGVRQAMAKPTQQMES